MALLCSIRWSDQKCCIPECVALKTSLQTRPMWALRTHFLARYRFLKWWSKFRIFYETLKIFSDFSRENDGHGGHDMVSAGGFSGVSFHLRTCPQGGRLCTLQENPHFWVQAIKVRQPDGTLLWLLGAASWSRSLKLSQALSVKLRSDPLDHRTSSSL